MSSFKTLVPLRYLPEGAFRLSVAARLRRTPSCHPERRAKPVVEIAKRSMRCAASGSARGLDVIGAGSRLRFARRRFAVRLRARSVHSAQDDTHRFTDVAGGTPQAARIRPYGGRYMRPPPGGGSRQSRVGESANGKVVAFSGFRGLPQSLRDSSLPEGAFRLSVAARLRMPPRVILSEGRSP